MTDALEVIYRELLDRGFSAIGTDAAGVIDALQSAGIHLMQWRPIKEAAKDGTPIDVWLGDAEATDVEFYCTEGTRRSPGWWWKDEKWRPCAGLPGITVFVQPTHYMPLPAAPETDDG